MGCNNCNGHNFEATGANHFGEDEYRCMTCGESHHVPTVDELGYDPATISIPDAARIMEEQAGVYCRSNTFVNNMLRLHGDSDYGYRQNKVPNGWVFVYEL